MKNYIKKNKFDIGQIVYYIKDYEIRYGMVFKIVGFCDIKHEKSSSTIIDMEIDYYRLIEIQWNINDDKEDIEIKEDDLFSNENKARKYLKKILREKIRNV